MDKNGKADLIDIAGVPDFWSHLARAGHCLLGLDYDGTLAPFHADPMQATPFPGIPAILDQIRGLPHVEIVIVSGRPVVEIVDLLGELGVTMIGAHGYERRFPDGRVVVTSPSGVQLDGLEAAHAKVLQQRLPGRLECKVASVAFHTRGLPPEVASNVEGSVHEQWAAMAGNHDLEVRRFNGGVEIRSQGRQKGDAFRDIMAEQPSESLVVYVGDDETDEDVFRLIHDVGVGIKVGNSAVFGSTAARGFLDDCSRVGEFLMGCLRELSRKSH